MGRHAAGTGGPRHPLVADALGHSRGHRHDRQIAGAESALGWPGESSPPGGRQGWPGDVSGESDGEAAEEPAPVGRAA